MTFGRTKSGPRRIGLGNADVASRKSRIMQSHRATSPVPQTARHPGPSRTTACPSSVSRLAARIPPARFSLPAFGDHLAAVARKRRPPHRRACLERSRKVVCRLFWPAGAQWVLRVGSRETCRPAGLETPGKAHDAPWVQSVRDVPGLDHTPHHLPQKTHISRSSCRCKLNNINNVMNIANVLISKQNSEFSPFFAPKTARNRQKPARILPEIRLRSPANLRRVPLTAAPKHKKGVRRGGRPSSFFPRSSEVYLLVCTKPACFSSRAACAAASRAVSNRKGEQET